MLFPGHLCCYKTSEASIVVSTITTACAAGCRFGFQCNIIIAITITITITITIVCA
jgi:hypothetical protein